MLKQMVRTEDVIGKYLVLIPSRIDEGQEHLLQMKRFVQIYPQDLAVTEALLTRHREISV